MFSHRFLSLRFSAAAAAALVASSAVPNAHAAPGDAPPLLSFEGRLLRADGTPEGGLVNLIFRMYEFATGGADAWSESQYITLATGGYYAVHLGSITPLPPFDGRNYWLGITFAGEAEMAPRARLVSVPYALRATFAAQADDAARLGGDASSEFLRPRSPLDASKLLTGKVPLTVLPSIIALLNSANSGDFFVVGNVGIGTSFPSARLMISDSDTNTAPLRVDVAMPPSFPYRRGLTISNAGSPLSDYQLGFLLNTASLVSASKLRADCGDLRFSDSDGSGLPYWIESSCNSASTRIWVRIPSLPGGTKTIYVYYGNSSLTSTSSGVTFEAFYDLRGLSGLPSGWTSGGTVNFGSAGITVDFGGYAVTTTTFGNAADRILDAYIVMPNSGGGNSHYTIGFATNANLHAGGRFIGHTLYSGNGTWECDPNTCANITQTLGLAYGTSGLVSVQYGGGGAKLYINYGLSASANSGLAPSPLQIGINNNQGAGSPNTPATLSWIRIRKLASPEPTTSAGPEEAAPAQMTPALYVQNKTGYVGIGTANPLSTLHVDGTFTATGTKSARVRTASFGERKLYSVEAPTVRFVDEGTARLSHGAARVELDPVFVETIEGEPLIQLTPYGRASVYVAERGRGYFVVKSVDGKDVAFAWYVSGARKGYGGVRLEETK